MEKHREKARVRFVIATIVMKVSTWLAIVALTGGFLMEIKQNLEVGKMISAWPLGGMLAVLLSAVAMWKMKTKNWRIVVGATAADILVILSTTMSKDVMDYSIGLSLFSFISASLICQLAGEIATS